MASVLLVPDNKSEDKHVESKLVPRLDESSNLSTSTSSTGGADFGAAVAVVILATIREEESHGKVLRPSRCNVILKGFALKNRAPSACHAERSEASPPKRSKA